MPNETQEEHAGKRTVESAGERVAEQTEERAEALLENDTAEGPIAGLGVDIVEIARMEQVLERTPRFAVRVFTEAERAYCERMRRPAVHYATHFAAKEAMVKALGTGFAEGIGFTDVEVAHNEKGKPISVLDGRAAEIAAEQGVLEMHLSLSRTQDTAVANAVAVTEQVKPQKTERVDPRAQLSAAFKELRSMLDEMEEALPEAEPPQVEPSQAEPSEDGQEN